MIAPPPRTLHVEGASHETRIILEHGGPSRPTVFWKRIAVALWFGCLIVCFFLPFLLCPLVGLSSLLVGLAYLSDAARRDVQRVILRSDHLRVVRRGLTGKTTDVVPYSSVESVQLASDGRGGRRRDAVVLRWAGEGGARSVWVGRGREAGELSWIREALGLIVTRAKGGGAG